MRRIVAGAAGRSRKADGAEGEIERKRPLRRKKKKTIAVVGISRRAGTTFVATSLAFLLSKFVEKCRNSEEAPMSACVTYVEMRRPIPGESQVFFSAGLDRRFGSGRFTDFFQLYKEGKPLNRNVNLHKGINWVVWRHSGGGGEADCDYDHDYSGLPFGQLAGDYVVADSPCMETLKQYDLVVAVIDPMPGCVFAGAANYEKLRDLEMSGLPILWVVNRDDNAVNHGELRRFLCLKDYLPIPLLEGKLFYESQYTCSLPVELVLKGARNDGEGSDALQKLAETAFL